MPANPGTALDRERFVSLTTFRRSGEAVSTPVWIGQDGDALIVLTPDETGKVKRLRHDPARPAAALLTHGLLEPISRKLKATG